MGRGKRERRKAAGQPRDAAGGADHLGSGESARSRPTATPQEDVLSVGAAVAVLAIVAGSWWWHSGRQPRAPLAGVPPAAHPSASYVGQRGCARNATSRRSRAGGDRTTTSPCSRRPTRPSLGDFTNARFTLRRRDLDASRAGTASSSCGPMAPTARSHDYEITYTFGVAPLQQYLIEFPGRPAAGALDRLGHAPAGRGRPALVPPLPGPERRTTGTSCTGPGSSRTGTTCAPSATRPTCARTTMPTTERYATTLGRDQRLLRGLPRPGSRHVAWAEEARATGSASTPGRRASPSRCDDAGASPGRSTPTTGNRAARAPRGRRTRGRDLRALPRAPRPVLRRLRARPARSSTRTASRCSTRASTTPTARSTTRSTSTARSCRAKMFHAGVTCSDCHDPHSLKLRAPGHRCACSCHAALEVRRRRRITSTSRARRRRLRRLPHAATHLHGGRPAPRSQLPHSAARPHGEARHAQRLHALPRRPASRVGGEAGGGLVRASPFADTSATARRSERPRSAARARRSCCRPSPVMATSRPSRARLRSGAWVHHRARRPSRSSARGSRTATRWCAARLRALSRASTPRCARSSWPRCSTTPSARCAWKRRVRWPMRRGTG